MRVPIDWLHDYVKPELDTRELAGLLALTGTEVERIERHGVPDGEGFVVGHVLERHKHPDADRLNVCLVDLGGGETRQIVCGAPNVDAGLTVAVAQPGSVMPDGTKLKKAKLRGQESHGMILSERELQISAEHDGIMVLSPELVPGTPLARAVPLATDVLVLEITPNRPDCLGIYGVAREVAAATGAELAPPPWEQDPGSLGELEGITIVNEAGPELNPRFTARIFDRVKPAQSPVWMKARLMAAGMRPISNVVDITNYAMWVTGQPLHAFDYDRIAGRRLTVRRATPGEQLPTLDDQTRTLDPDTLVIADAEGPTSLAGVMGGARSEVSDQTTTVLLEAATWSGPNIHQTSHRLALHSEAATRFAKGIAPEQTLWAQAVAAKLLVEVAGAQVRPGTTDIGGPRRAARPLALRTARVEKLLGARVEPADSARVLSALGFASTPTQAGLEVRVPDFRANDVTREVDLIEEVARLEVLGQLPVTLPPRRQAVGALTERQRLRRRAADLLCAHGVDEVIGWSFTSPEQNRKLGFEPEPVRLANPMSTEQSQLRTTLLGSLLDIAAHNHAHRAGRIAIFEMGAVYRPELIDTSAEDVHLVALLNGPVRPPSWREQQPPAADFFTAKGIAQGLLDGLGADWRLERGQLVPALHPSRSAVLYGPGPAPSAAAAAHEPAAPGQEERLGFIGELHPRVVEAWDLEGTVAVLAVNLDKLALPPVRRYRDILSFPEVREDLAVVLSDEISAARLTEVIRGAAGALLRSVEVFDVYRDAERLGAGKVSLAVRLAFGAADRTLTDEEVAAKRRKIVAAIEQQLAGSIRG